MSTTSTARERFHLVNVLGPLGLPIRVIAQAAGCSESIIHRDLRGEGGITGLFPDRPTKHGEIYARTLQYFAAYYRRNWKSRPEHKAIEDYLGLKEIYLFLEGLCAAHHVLHLPGCCGDVGDMRLIHAVLIGWDTPLDDHMADHYMNRKVDGWFATTFKQARHDDQWPTSVSTFKHRLVEDFRIDSDRSHLRGASRGELADAVEKAFASLGSELEVKVLRYRYGLGELHDPMDLSEVGRVMQLTRERIRQIEYKALRKLRKRPHNLHLVAVLGLSFEDFEKIEDNLRALQLEHDALTEEMNRAFEFYERASEVLGADHPLVREYTNGFGKAELSPNLMKRVDELELSVRSQYCLANAGIEFIFQLITQTESEMLQTRNYGRKALHEIKRILAELGLSLGTALSPREQRAVQQFMAGRT